MGSKVYQDNGHILRCITGKILRAKIVKETSLGVEHFRKVKCCLQTCMLTSAEEYQPQTGACPDIVLVKSEKQQDGTSANEECF